MSYVMNADVFASRGDDWAALARREPVPSGPRVIEVVGPSWRDVELRWRNDGFAPDGEPTKAQPRPHVPSPQRRQSERSKLMVEMRSENGPTYRAPEYRRVVREGETCGRHPEAKDVVLTPEMLEKRKRQQAAVKARMTKAANRIKRDRQEAWSILLSL